MKQEEKRLLLHRRDVIGRIAVTLVALAVYRLTLVLPLPGVAVAELGTADVQVLHRVSFGAIAVVAWLSAVMLGELAALLFPQRWTASFVRNGHADPFALPLLLLALALSAIQGWGLATAMESVPRMVVEPGAEFQLGAVASLMAGTTIAIAIGRVIQAYGLGYGFWVLIAAHFIGPLADLPVRLGEALITGQVLLLLALSILGASVAAFAGVVALVLARRKMGFERQEPLVWPVLLAGLVSPYLVVLVSFPFGFMDAGDAGTQLAMLGVATAALTIAFVWLYARREESMALALPTAAVLVALIAIPIVAASLEPLLVVLTAGQTAVVATVGAVVAGELRQV